MKVALLVLSAVVCTLGAPSSDLGWRIVGGTPAKEGQFPYQISLRKDGSHLCGGSILDNTTILCAAHCFDGVSASSLTVVTGSNKLNEGGDVYNVSSFTVHEDWSRKTLKNDISIIKLSEEIEMNDNVKTIELRDTNIDGDEECILSGWGYTSYPGSTPNELEWIYLQTVSAKDCKETQWSTDKTQLCTLTQIGEGACHGDSGGPLVDSEFKQIGIVSWGNPCATGRPDVFTRVFSFLDWIEENRE